MIKQGNLRGEKVQYDDGIGCCIWKPFPNEKDDNLGLCWDFSLKDVDDLIKLIEALKEMPVEQVVHADPEPKVKRKINILQRVRNVIHEIGWKLVSI